MAFQVVSIWLAILIFIINSEAKNLKSPSASTITLEDILSSKYASAGYNGKWISDNEVEHRIEGHIYVYNVDTNLDTLQLNTSLFDSYPPGKSISLSPDRKFALIAHNIQPKWRYSTFANYDIYDISTGTTEQISIDENRELALFQWAPSTAEFPNAFAFVHKNNIFYRESAAAPNTPFVQLTLDGVENGASMISNGLSDWVYEEEMFGSSSALWFGKDSKNLAFVKFDDTLVKEFQYPMYGDESYPNWIDIRYPKAGAADNPIVTLNVVNLAAENPAPTTFTYAPAIPPEKLHYIATVKWLTVETLLVVHLNRAQTLASYFVCTVSTVLCEPRFEETATNAWIDVYTPHVSEDGRYLMTILPTTVGESVAYKQINKIDLIKGEKVAVTNQYFAVGSILGWDEIGSKVYFSATGLGRLENSPVPFPSDTWIYSVVVGPNIGTAVCLTCGTANTDGENCKENSASFSKDFNFWIHTCSGPGIPEVYIRENKGDFINKRTVQDNGNLRKLLVGIKLPSEKTYNIQLPDTDFSVHIKLFLPADFDEKKKYPLLIDVYGGPGSQTISSGFRIDWGTSLASDKKIIYGLIDGRGSGGQTQELMNSVYRRLGTYEVQDQIFATKWLINNQKFIDANHTGIWGWSYGGFASAMALTLDTENTFKCAMAVAPVTSWRYYDTIYTERFMGLPTPEDNEAGYNQGQVTTKAESFRNKDFLLVHGNADDNVHYQQSMILTRALEKADIIFDQLSYPDEAHSISGTRNHLYHSFERFLFRTCLNQKVPAEKAPAQGDPTQKDDTGNNASVRLGTWFQLKFMSLLAIWCQVVLM